MVKRTFLSLSVFLAGVFLCNHAKSDDQHGNPAATASACEAWSYGYEGCWYDDTSDHCPHDMVEAVPTPAAVEQQVAESQVDEQDAYESRYSKYYGYEWEYDDYDSAYDDDTWLEPIAETEVDTEVMTEVVQADETPLATASDDSTDWMVDEYDYWSEYRYDDDFRYYESTVQATPDVATEICPATEQPASVEEEEVLQVSDKDVVSDGQADDVDTVWNDEYDYDHEYYYEYGYEYQPNNASTSDIADAQQPLEETVVAESVVETQAADADDAQAFTNEYDCDDGDYYYDYSDYYYGYEDDDSSMEVVENDDASAEDESEVEAVESPNPQNAAILTLARSLDQLGSTLQMLSRQLTDMATPEVATRPATSDSHQH